jgi:hypothetical protein
LGRAVVETLAAEELAAVEEDAAAVGLIRGMLVVSAGWASVLERTVATSSLSVVSGVLVSVAEMSLSTTGVAIVAVSVGVVVTSVLVDVSRALPYRLALALAARARPAMS